MSKGLLITTFLIVISIFVVFGQYTISDNLPDKKRIKNYIIANDTVYYQSLFPNATLRGIPYPKMFECDVKSFEVLKGEYAKDKYNVYFRGKKINDVDPTSYQQLSLSYAKDNKHVFYYGKPLKGIDAKSFKLYYTNYNFDTNHVYYKHEIIEGANPATFRRINLDYAKDDVAVYYKKSKVLGAKF